MTDQQPTPKRQRPWGLMVFLFAIGGSVLLMLIESKVKQRDQGRERARIQAQLDREQLIECPDVQLMRPGQLVVISGRANSITGRICFDTLMVRYRGYEVPRHIRERQSDLGSIVMLRGRLEYVGDLFALTDAVDILAPDAL